MRVLRDLVEHLVAEEVWLGRFHQYPPQLFLVFEQPKYQPIELLLGTAFFEQHSIELNDLTNILLEVMLLHKSIVLAKRHLRYFPAVHQ